MFGIIPIIRDAPCTCVRALIRKWHVSFFGPFECGGERERERVYRGASAAEAKGGWASMSREGWVANRGFAKQCRLVVLSTFLSGML